MDSEFSRKRVLKAWWAMQWRAVLATFIGAFVLIFIFSFISALLGATKEFIAIGGNIIYTFVAIFASIYFFGFALKKDYGTFRFAVLEKGENEKSVVTGESEELSSKESEGLAPYFKNSTKERE